MVRPAETAKKVEVKTRSDLRKWLQAHCLQNDGVWLVKHKKPHKYYLSYDDIIEECICFGWIDSLPRKLDEQKTILYISPRKKGSNWSKANKERVKKLELAGLIQEAGLIKIDRALSGANRLDSALMEKCLFHGDTSGSFRYSRTAAAKQKTLLTTS